jgi:hypothetical protein
VAVYGHRNSDVGFMSVESLLRLDINLFYLNFVSVIIAFLFTLKNTRLNSTLLALSIAIIFNYLMTSYTPTLYALSVTHQSGYLHEFRALWYLGYTFCDIMIITFVLLGHIRFELERSFCANVVLLAYFCKLQLHLAMYFEIEVLGTEHLAFFFEKGIPAINIIFASVVFGFITTIVGSLAVSKVTGFKRISWTI